MTPTKVFPLPGAGSLQVAPIILFFPPTFYCFFFLPAVFSLHKSQVGGELLLPWRESIPGKNSRWKLERAEGLKNKHAQTRLFLQA